MISKGFQNWSLHFNLFEEGFYLCLNSLENFWCYVKDIKILHKYSMLKRFVSKYLLSFETLQALAG